MEFSNQTVMEMFGLTAKQQEIATFLEDNYKKSIELQTMCEAVRHLADLTYGKQWIMNDDILKAYNFIATVNGDCWNYSGD